MLPKQLEKARRLKQREVTWFATRRRAYSWIDPKGGDPYRPYIVLVVEAEQGRIRRTDISGDLPTPRDVLASLLTAMRRPMIGSGGRYRPARIVLDDSALVDALASSLSQIDVRCTYQHTLSLVQDTLDSMAARMYGQEMVPGLLSVPGITVPMAGELFTVAADFYRQAPWEWLDNKSPIEVRYPHDGQARYALVLGSGRETFGLASYESLADIYTVYFSDTPRDPIAPVPWFSLVFDEPMATSFYDLDAIEKYHWPVAAELAYPMAMRLVRGADTFTIPTADEIAWLAAALRTIPDFITRHLHATRGLPRPAEATYGLPGIHGGRRIALCYRGDLWELEMQQEEQAELEDFIEDWYYDDASHEFARQVGQFLFEFLDDLDAQGFSDRTYNKHVDNCWLIGKFTCDYGYHETFSPQVFQGGPSYLYEFRRKVSDAPSAVKSYQSTWRKLARYAQKRQSQNQDGVEEKVA